MKGAGIDTYLEWCLHLKRKRDS